MKKLLEIVLAGSLSFISGCYDPQVGINYREVLDGNPAVIRKEIVIREGDPVVVTRSGETLLSAKRDMYFLYNDKNNNGSFDKEIDTSFTENSDFYKHEDLNENYRIIIPPRNN